jgi:hypothetical protein
MVPDGVVKIFHRLNPSVCTVTLGSTQPASEMTTRHLPSGVKAVGALG